MLLILDVDADKYESTVEALKKRPSIRVVSMDREGRKKFVDCPCCSKRLSREQSFTVNGQFIECLTQIAQKMTIDKTVIPLFDGSSLMAISPIERDRCLILDEKTVKRAETLGLVRSFVDGMKTTYYVTAAGLGFLSGEKPAAPSTIVTLDGEVVETTGELLLDNVKFVDAIHGETIKRNARDSVKRIPERVMEFVVNGQMTLI
jgi:hypothetical protein